MGRAPSSGDSNCGSPSGLIDSQIGEHYDNIKTVAENIEALSAVGENIAEILAADANLEIIAGHRIVAEQAAADADADRIASTAAAATATAAAASVTQAALDADADRIAAEAARAAAVVAQLAAEAAAEDAVAGGVSSVNGRNGAVILAKGDVGLGNADNTSDANKPISTAQATALATKLSKDGSANQFVNVPNGSSRYIGVFENRTGLGTEANNPQIRFGVFGDNKPGYVEFYGAEDPANQYGWMGWWEAGRLTFGGNWRFRTNILINDKAVWHAGNFDPVNYLTKAAPTITGSTLWINTDKMYLQHTGAHGYVRSEVGNLILGAGGFNLFTLEADGDGHLAGDLLVGGDDLTIGSGGGAEHRLTFSATGGGYWYGNATNVGFFKAGGASFFVNHANGNLQTNGEIAGADIRSVRTANPAEGVIFLGNSNGRYLHYDGATYHLPGANLTVNGQEVGFKAIPKSRQMGEPDDHSLLAGDNGKWIALVSSASAKAMYVQNTSLGAAYTVGNGNGIVVVRNMDTVNWAIGLGAGVTLLVNGETVSRAPTLQPGCIATFVRWENNDWTVSGPGVV
jgi:hypothetical protein